MATPRREGSGFPTVAFEDLQDKTLARLNRILQMLAIRIADRDGDAGPAADAPPASSAGVRVSSGSVAQPGSTRELYYREWLLEDASTEITSPSASIAEGDELILDLVQDSTGGRQITFAVGPPAFKRVSVNDMDPRPNRISTLRFLAHSDGDWYLVGMLLGRQDP